VKINLVLLALLCSLLAESQQQSDITPNSFEINPLRPAKATFYSTVFPGLGQIYNKRYWKLPIIYGGIGASIYYYDINNKNFKRYRNAYKRRIAGYDDDEFQGIISDDDRLIDGMNFYRNYRDRSMLFIVGTYLLNILDANIDAHLKQYNLNENLTLRPYFESKQIIANHNVGVLLTINF
jgi:hypothetical protein